MIPYLAVCVCSHVHDESEARKEVRNKWYNVAMLSKYALLIQLNLPKCL